MKKIYTAPIAGVTDYSFRRILEEFNPDLIFTEMVSVNALSVLNEKTISKILRLRQKNAVQIFGENLDKLKYSAKFIEKLGVKHLNLNCGCPMRKIVNCGYGAALLKEPEKIRIILSELRDILDSETELSIKIRIGYSRPENYLEIAKIAEQEKCSEIVIHARTRDQLYSGKADWRYIKEIKENINIPVIGNGDIFTAEDAIEKLSFSKADGVMLARGIFGNPWLIRDIKEILEFGEKKSIIDEKDKIKMAIKHLNYSEEDNDGKFVFDVRKHICWYLKGIKNIAEVKNRINKMDSYKEITNTLEKLL